MTSSRQLKEKQSALAIRGRVLASIRRWFADQNFLEVETPLRIPAPAVEVHIDAEPSGSNWLRTSPELHMKRLLAAGYDRIYQMGPCFRQREFGARHHPEYCMLEWYRADADYRDILADMMDLIRFVCREITGGSELACRSRTIQIGESWSEIPVREAFSAAAGWDPVLHYDADRFDLDLVEKVEPWLPGDRPSILIDYPAEAAAFARCREEAEGRVAERWELYIGGLELANAYSELVDPAEQRQRFEAYNRERVRLGKAAYPLDEPFLRAMEEGLPICGGVALGVDRLVMLFADAETLDDVIAFRDVPSV